MEGATKNYAYCTKLIEGNINHIGFFVDGREIFKVPLINSTPEEIEAVKEAIVERIIHSFVDTHGGWEEPGAKPEEGKKIEVQFSDGATCYGKADSFENITAFQHKKKGIVKWRYVKRDDQDLNTMSKNGN